jgi:hypothetical protein
MSLPQGAGRNLLGVGFLIPVIALRIWIERRVFMRMSSGGVEQFETYGGLWKARLIEGSAKFLIALLALIAAILIVLGVIPMLH